jgi:hypothetical protein
MLCCEIAVKERDKFSWDGTRKRVGGQSLKRAEKDDRATVERQLVHLLCWGVQGLVIILLLLGGRV